MSDPWDTAGYIASSRYRVSVCEFLATDGPELPSRIATELELAQPHVSRALSELRDRDIVELLVPESQQKGRLYGLTPEGKTALNRLQGEARSVSVSFVGADTFPHTGLVDYLQTEHGEALRFVLACEGDDSTAFVASEDARDTFDERSLSTVVAAFRAGDAAVAEETDGLPTGRSRFVVRGFERALLIRLPLDDDEGVFVSLDGDADLHVRSFADACRARLN